MAAGGGRGGDDVDLGDAHCLVGVDWIRGLVMGVVVVALGAVGRLMLGLG